MRPGSSSYRPSRTELPRTARKTRETNKQRKKRNVTSEHLTCHQETLLPNNVYSAVCSKKKKKKMKKFNLNVGPDNSLLIANTEGFVSER